MTPASTYPPPAILPDFTDVDDDGDPNEVTPWNIRPFRRILQTSSATINDPNSGPAYVDMGAEEACPYDVDGDGVVGLSDLAIVLANYGTDCRDDPNELPADCDRTSICWRVNVMLNQCVIDLTTLATVLANYDSHCLPSSGSFAASGESNGALAQWLQTATVEELLAWYEAGMPTDIFGGDQ